MKYMNLILILLINFDASAQSLQMGGWDGSNFPTQGLGAGIPRMENFSLDPWNDPNRPNFLTDDQYTPNPVDPLMPEELFPNIQDIFPRVQPPLPGAPTPLDLITNNPLEQTDPSINPEGLTLPDPEWDPESPLAPQYPFQVIEDIQKSALVDLSDVEPFILPDDLDPELFKKCEELPSFSAKEYVMSLNSDQLTPSLAKKYHWLWAAQRSCLQSAEINLKIEDIRFLSGDPRCIFTNSEDYMADIDHADSVSEAIVIEALYGYFYLCEN